MITLRAGVGIEGAGTSVPRRFRSSMVLLCAVVALGVFATGCESVPVTLSGTVTNYRNWPPPDYPALAQVGVAVRVYSNSSETLVATTYTNKEGEYRFTADVLADGTYRVQFADGDWWHGGTTWADATPVVVSSATPVVIDRTLDFAVGAISGSLNVPDMMTVVAFDKATGRAVSTATQVSFRFRLGNLPPGTYTLGFFDPAGIVRPSIFGSTSSDPTTGTPITVQNFNYTVSSPAHIRMVGQDCSDTYAGADLSGVDFSGAVRIGCDFTGADLTGADFTGADLTGSIFRDADLTGATITDANLTNADFYGVRSSGVTGTPGEAWGLDVAYNWPTTSDPWAWRLINGYIVGSGAHLEWAGLAGADLSNASLHHTHLNNADLSGANMSEAILFTTDLAGADLSGANLTEAAVLTTSPEAASTFDGADLSNANLTSSILEGSSFVGANFTGVNLTNSRLAWATLTGVTSSGITGTPWELPAGWTLVGGVLVGP